MGRIKKEIRHKVFLKYNGKCSYCGCKIKFEDFHVDHIIPRNRGDINDPNIINGRNHIDNYNPSCAPCNLYKSNFSMEVFRQEIGLKVERLRRDSSSFRMLERYGLVKTKEVAIEFYFETL